MFASITAAVCGLSLAVAAQAPPTPPAAPPGPAKLRPDKPAPGIPPPAPRPGKDINIRIDATVIESRGDHVVDKKVISVTCVDGKGAFVRSTQSVAFKAKGSEGFNYQDAPLNMDADVNLRDKHGRTPLTYATTPAGVKGLTRAGAELNVRDKARRDVTHWLKKNGVGLSNQLALPSRSAAATTKKTRGRHRV
jgi:hypothetical protein